MDPIVVMGAGAAGIMAAYRAAELGANAILLEKTSRIGTKILISGGGKCNITHDGPLEDVLKPFRPNEARFIRPACYRWTNDQIVAFLTDRGLRVYTRDDGRIFPVDQTAKDVVAILHARLKEVGVDIRLDTPATGVERDGNGVCAVLVGDETIRTRSVVLAVGGSSYPKSGTTGDGWRWAVRLGHSLVPIQAALAPIILRGKRWQPYSGVALRDCELKARQGDKVFVRWRGDLLFTHIGVSGPCTLGISREVTEALERGEVSLEVDLLPDTSFESLNADLQEYARAHPKRRVSTYLESVMPNRLADEMFLSAGLSVESEIGQLKRAERNRLVACLKGWKLGTVFEVVLDKGEIVAGGISLDEVDPHSMRSLKCPGLFVCGEALDIAGPIGGYNLQAAFSTGYVAGESAAEK
ncbi:MAG: aminoacetone oxidase family FAD-binding enzyme [Armatimonadetes bacterium]|nr:aminoacetone oxidase family FAD-binding enzyme [Armatimonadota bacterium]